MARFSIGQAITTAEPVIVVDAGLQPGRHLFQLEVATPDGRISKPDRAIVTVTASRPGPVITGPVNPAPVTNRVNRPVISGVPNEDDEPPA